MKSFLGRIALKIALWLFERWKETIKEEGREEAQAAGAEKLKEISDEQEKARAASPSDDDLLKRLRGQKPI